MGRLGVQRVRSPEDILAAAWASRRPAEDDDASEVPSIRVLDSGESTPSEPRPTAARAGRGDDLPARQHARSLAPAPTGLEPRQPALFVEGPLSNVRHHPRAQTAGPAWNPIRGQSRRAMRRANGWSGGHQRRGVTGVRSNVLAGTKSHEDVIWRRRIAAARRRAEELRRAEDSTSTLAGPGPQAE